MPSAETKSPPPQGPSGAATVSPIFRAEAIRHRQRPLNEDGQPLRLTPSWLDSAYRSLMVLGLAGLALVLLGSSSEYATGPAVIRLAERVEINARATGTVSEISVSAGDPVVAGQVLGRLESSRERAEVEKLRRDLEHRLIERLRDFGGESSGGGLEALEEEKRLAESRLALRSLRAPQDGVVGDVLLRTGKLIEAGQLAFTVITPTESDVPKILALFPGRYRPLLDSGMEVRLRLTGYRGADQRFIIEEVSDSVISPQEARSIVGLDTASSDDSSRGFVLARASLPSAHFEVSGQRYKYFDGLTGSAEVPVRKRRLLSQFLPGVGGEEGGAR